MLRPVLTCVTALGLLAAVSAQGTKSLTIGDPAPPLKVESWVKGKPFEIEKGKVYVVEFWATWCGPCIQSMPHLSEMADKMKGKAEFVSVNMADRRPEGESTPNSQVHVDRITKWVNENTDKMRYNVVLDDAAGTMAKTWMTAAGQNGIPCAFIVDQEGTIAWIGHPMDKMDETLEAIHAKTFDKAAFKTKYDNRMQIQRDAQAEMQAFAKMAAEGDAEGCEKAYNARVAKLKRPDLGALSAILPALSKKNPAAGLKFLQNHVGEFANDASTVGMLATYMAPNVKDNPEVSKGLLDLSLKNAEKASEGVAALAYAYHARVLFGLGDVNGANEWLTKASDKVGAYEPAQGREGIKKYIEDLRTSFAKAGGG